MISSKSDTILRYGLYLIMLLPLAFTPFTFFPWHFGKTIIFQIIVEVLAFFWLCNYLSSRANPDFTSGEVEGSKIRRLNKLDWSIILFLAVLFITGLIGVNPQNSFWGNQARANGVFTWLHFGAFYFLLKWFFQKYGGRERIYAFPTIIVIVVIVAFLSSLTAIFPNILSTDWQNASGGGIIGNRAFLASYLILAIGISLYLFARYENKWRWLFLASAILFFYTIFDTGNRGALLGMVSGAFFGLALCLFFVRYKKIKLWSAIFLFVFCFLFLILFLSRQSLFWQKYFPPLSSLASVSLTSGTAETRLMAWQSGWNGFKEKPLLGWGWGNFEIIFDKYYNPQFLKHSFAETVWDKPHNWLLEIGVTSGILGVVGYLAILFFAGYYLLRHCHCEPCQAGQSNLVDSIGKIILSSTLIAYFIAGLFLFETTDGLILWFVILAFVSATISRTSLFPANLSVSGKTRSNVAVKIIIIFFISFSLYYFHYLPIKSSYYMRQAELASNINDWSTAAQKTLAIPAPFLSENAIFLAEQLTKFDKAGAVSKDANIENTALLIAKTLDNESKNRADNLAFPIWAGQAYLVLGEKIDEKYYVEAEGSLLRALKIAPRKQEVLFLLVRLYLLKQEFVKAIDFAQKAVDVAPDISTSHWFLGLANVASGNRPQGLKSIEKAIELGYSFTVDQKLYVLDLYALEKNYSKLIDEYKKMIEADPENVNWLIKLAAIYAESGDKKAALETTRHAVGLFPPLKAEAEKFIKQYKLLENK